MCLCREGGKGQKKKDTRNVRLEACGVRTKLNDAGNAIFSLVDLLFPLPVRVWKQCILKVSVSSISMPLEPGTGEILEVMAWTLC